MKQTRPRAKTAPPRAGRVAIIVFKFDRVPFVVQLIHELVSELCRDGTYPTVIIEHESVGQSANVRLESVMRQILQRNLEFNAYLLVSLPPLDETVILDFCKTFHTARVVAVDVDPLPHTGALRFPKNYRFVGTDNEAGARRAAELVKRYAPASDDRDPKVLVLSAKIQPERGRVVEDVLKRSKCGVKLVTILDVVPKEVMSVQVEKAVRTYINTHGAPAAIFGATDEIAIEACDVLQTYRPRPRTAVVGFDGIPLTLDILRTTSRQQLKATVVQPIRSIADTAVGLLWVHGELGRKLIEPTEHKEREQGKKRSAV